MRNLLIFSLFLTAWMVAPIQQCQALDAAFSYAIYSNGETPYIEMNMEVSGASITFNKVDSTHIQGGVEVTIIFKQGEKVHSFEKYALMSPLLLEPQSLLDVKRFPLPNGVFTVEVVFKDVNDAKNVVELTKPIEVQLDDKLYLSEVQLMRQFKRDESENPFVKNGFFMEPLPFLFYNKYAKKLAFYTEIYNTDKVFTEKYLVRYYVEEQTNLAYSRLVAVGSQRKSPTAMDGILAEMDISEVGSGNYQLTVEVRNPQTNAMVISRKVAFQRSLPPAPSFVADQVSEEQLANQFVQNMDEPALRYALRAIGPVVGNTDSETLKLVLENGDVKAMRFFLFNHFVKKNPKNPDVTYNNYMEVAGAVDKLYKSGFGYGFETDRGVTFMKYGKPDDVIKVEDDPAAPPYEIWVYYKFPITQQSNVKFLFYNPNLAGGDYVILHSTARGERNNPRWETDLYRRNAPTQVQGDDDFDARSMQRNSARNARAYFDDF